MMTGSEPNYIEHLDKLSALIEKYEDTHNIVIAGDLNSSLLPARNNNHEEILPMWLLFELEHVQNHLVDVDPQFWYLVGYYFVYSLRCNQFEHKTILKWEETNIHPIRTQ
jgi:hypothetical protein